MPLARNHAWRLRDTRYLEDRLGGRRVLLTGASGGIGRAAAVRIGAARAHVLLVARRADELESAASQIRRAGGRASTCAADLTDNSAVDRVLERVDELGGVDVLVNNAGRSIRRPVERSYGRIRDLERLMQLNFLAAMRLTLGVLPGMQDRSYGHIINVSSMGTQNSTPPFSAYNASKGAMTAWTRTAAAEMGDGVTLTTVNMPLVDTAMSSATAAYDDHGLMSPEDGADYIVAALVHRRPRVGPPLGVLGEIVGAISPGAHRRACELAYRRVPAYEAYLGRGPGR